METFTYYQGEHVIFGGVLKDGDNVVTGKTLVARFYRGCGAFAETLGEETFEEAEEGTYVLTLDTAKYTGTLSMRIYIKEADDYIIVGEDPVELKGKMI